MPMKINISNAQLNQSMQRLSSHVRAVRNDSRANEIPQDRVEISKEREDLNLRDNLPNANNRISDENLAQNSAISTRNQMLTQYSASMISQAGTPYSGELSLMDTPRSYQSNGAASQLPEVAGSLLDRIV